MIRVSSRKCLPHVWLHVLDVASVEPRSEQQIVWAREQSCLFPRNGLVNDCRNAVRRSRTSRWRTGPRRWSRRRRASSDRMIKRPQRGLASRPMDAW